MAMLCPVCNARTIIGSFQRHSADEEDYIIIDAKIRICPRCKSKLFYKAGYTSPDPKHAKLISNEAFLRKMNDPDLVSYFANKSPMKDGTDYLMLGEICTRKDMYVTYAVPIL